MGTMSASFYFIIGVIFGVYGYIAAKNRRKSSYVKENSSVHFYLNLFFLDHKEVVKNMVKEKIRPRGPVIRALAQRAAVAVLKNGIVEKIGNSMCENIPLKLGSQGITAGVYVKYTQGNYLCIEINLLKVNIFQMLESKRGIDFAMKVQKYLDYISHPIVDSYLNWALLTFMSYNMMNKMPIEMHERLLNEMKAEVEIFSCNEEEVGPFLLQTIELLTSVQKNNNSDKNIQQGGRTQSK